MCTCQMVKAALEVLTRAAGVKVLTEPEEFGGAYQVYVEVGGQDFVVCLSASELSRAELNLKDEG